MLAPSSSCYSPSLQLLCGTSVLTLLPSSISLQNNQRSLALTTSAVLSRSQSTIDNLFIEPLQSKTSADSFADTNVVNDGVPEEDDDSDDEEEKGISKIQVPRQKYIPVSKSDLLNGIVSKIFPSPHESHDDNDVQNFRLLSSCLDSILHAEHKKILEEMRTDYFQQNSVNKGLDAGLNGISSMEDIEGEEGFGNEVREARIPNNNAAMPLKYVLDFRNLLPNNNSSSPKNVNRVAVTTRFQCAFMQLLRSAEFEELSVRDLMLTSALNTDYLLTLPIYVDWKKASESNTIIFRRGYAAETQKGLLIVEKLDYLQSKLLSGLFSALSKPLGKIGSWMIEAFKDVLLKQEGQVWIRRLKLWLNELRFVQQSFQYEESTSDDQLGVEKMSDEDLPIWLAAQRAVSRYEGLLSPVGPRGRLLKKLISLTGLFPPTPEISFQLDGDGNTSEAYTRPIFLSRISLSDIWRPASRKYCGNDLWKMLKSSISILLSQSILREPAFQELILLYTEDVGERNTENEAETPELQLKIYERIPIPDLPVIFPHKKLSFRIIDTVRLDVATFVGLLAYFINYKFENLSSLSAVSLDVVAISALIIYITRVVLGYKQTRDRYQLLVNRALYEKTLASGFGSVHFLVDASEQQQYKEAILAYAILLKKEKGKGTCRLNVGNKCERFMYNVFKVKVEMPVEKAVNTLLRLGLATETAIDGRIQLKAVPCPEAHEALKERWNSLLSPG